ncbi:hypothetical protein R3P38DRAFT_3213879 [Favolaschia claudopus]|uniref:Uncharacterized protein n=1 Tax=Favolaschia claudopus TaxID=2862362 RepID=A0AAW0ACF2_9AGAR
MQGERAPRPPATGLRRPRSPDSPPRPEQKTRNDSITKSPHSSRVIKKVRADGPDAAPATISSGTTISLPVQPTLSYDHAPNAAPPRAAVPQSHTTIDYVSTKLREEVAALLERVRAFQQCVHDDFRQNEEVPKRTEDNIMALLPMVIEITETLEPLTTPYKQGLAGDSLEPDEAPVSPQSPTTFAEAVKAEPPRPPAARFLEG